MIWYKYLVSNPIVKREKIVSWAKTCENWRVQKSTKLELHLTRSIWPLFLFNSNQRVQAFEQMETF